MHQNGGVSLDTFYSHPVEYSKYMGDFFTALARVSGAFIAIFAVWSAVMVVVRLFNQESFGGDLIAAIIAGIMAALLLSVRDEKPPSSEDRRQD